jgi:hypothetical protein
MAPCRQTAREAAERLRQRIPRDPPNLTVASEDFDPEKSGFLLLEEGSFTGPKALEVVLATRADNAARNWSYQQYLLAHTAQGWTVSHHLDTAGYGWFRTVDVEGDGVAELVILGGAMGQGLWSETGELRTYSRGLPRILFKFRSSNDYVPGARMDGVQTVMRSIRFIDVNLDGKLELFETTRRLHYSHRLLSKGDVVCIPLPPVVMEERTFRMLRLTPGGYVPARLPSSPR